MRVAKIFVPLLIVSASALMIDAYVAQTPTAPAASENSMTQAREPDKETRIRNKLAELLSRTGARVGKTLPLQDSDTYKQLLVQWQSSGPTTQTSSVNLLKSPTLGVLTAVASTTKQGTVPRDRSFELSTNQILVIGLNRNAEVRWWRLMLDPRLVRSESPAPTGELSSEEYYLAKVDFTIEYPDDPEISELRIYHPQWNGKDFQLELISTLAVAQR